MATKYAVGDKVNCGICIGTIEDYKDGKYLVKQTYNNSIWLHDHEFTKHLTLKPLTFSEDAMIKSFAAVNLQSQYEIGDKVQRYRGDLIQCWDGSSMEAIAIGLIGTIQDIGTHYCTIYFPQLYPGLTDTNVTRTLPVPYTDIRKIDL